MSTRNPILATVIACAAMALVAALGGVVLGHPRAGFALAAGLLVGSANGYLAKRALAAGFGFTAGSGARLAVLTVVGLGIGLLLGIDVAWLTLLGLGLSQAVLAVVAAGSLIRR
jgi:hypothetical protein